MSWRDKAEPVDEPEEDLKEGKEVWRKEAEPLESGAANWQARAEAVEEPQSILERGRKAFTEAKAFMFSTAKEAPGAVGGILEQPAAGLGAVTEMATYGVAAGAKAAFPRIPFMPDVMEAFNSTLADENISSRIQLAKTPREVENLVAEQEVIRSKIKDGAAGMRIAASLPIYEVFNQEYEDLTTAVTPLNFMLESLKPETKVGQFIFHKLGEWIETGLSAFGDSVYEKGLLGGHPGGALGHMILERAGIETPESRALHAAGAKGGAAVLSMTLPGTAAKQYAAGAKDRAAKQEKLSKEQMDRDIKTNPYQFMQTYHPATWLRLEAAKTGKVKVGTAGGVEINVGANLANTLETLGVPKEAYQSKTIAEMMRMAIETVDKEGSINPNTRSLLIESVMEHVDHLSKVEKATAQRLLPAPSAIPGVIEVTASGRAATLEQRIKGYGIFGKLSNEQRAEVLGIGPMGVLRTHVDSLQRATREAASEGTEAGVSGARDALTTAWAQAFPLGQKHPGISKAQRGQVMQEWLDAGAPPIEWEALAAKVYTRPRPPRGGKQAGVVDIEGLEDLAKVNFATLVRLPSSPIITRKQVEEVLRQQDIQGGERTTVQRVLNQIEGDKFPARELAEKLGKEALPLEMRLSQEHNSVGHANVKEAGRREGDASFVFEGPWRTEVLNHFRDSPNYVAHIRGFKDRDSGVFHITEVQSDLYQQLDKQSPPTRRGSSDPFTEQTLQKYEKLDKLLSVITEQEFQQTRAIFSQSVLQLTNHVPKTLAEAQGYVRAGKEFWTRNRYGEGNPGSILDASKYWYERTLREFNKKAAEGLVAHADDPKTIRIPLGNTAAVIENWARTPERTEMTLKLNDGTEMPIEWHQEFGHGRGSWVRRNEAPMTEAQMDRRMHQMGEHYRRWLDENHLPQMSADEILNEFQPGTRDRLPLTNVQETYLTDFINEWTWLEERKAGSSWADIEQVTSQTFKNPDDFVNFMRTTGDLKHTVADKHKGLASFYDKDVRKFVEKEWNAKQVVDEKGHGWMEWEVDVASAGQRTPMFGRLNAGGKQRGIIDLEGLEKLPESAKQAAEMAKRASVVPPGGDAAGAKRVEDAWTASRRAAEESQRVTLHKLYQSARDAVADHQGTLKEVLVNRGGQFGQETVDRLNVLSGAVMKGKYVYETQAKPIFRDLTADQMVNLNKMVSVRNLIEANRRNPKYKSPDGMKAADGEGWIRELAKSDPRQFKVLDRAADKVFEVYRSQLEQLKEAGILSEENYKKAVSTNTLSEIVRILDPEVPGIVDIVSGKIATASGIPYIPIGKKGSMMSARALLSETIGRAQNQIMRNEAAKALYRTAEMNPNIGFMRTIEGSGHDAQGKAKGIYIPEGYMKVAFREGGKEKVLLIDKDLGEVWYNRPPALDSIVADIGRLVSGTSTVKALATSYNPLFPIAGVPMDAVHIFLAGQGYSSHIPVFLGELAVDMATVAKDAIKRGPRYQQAMMEGMGFDFMTHQGRDMFSHHTLEQQFNPTLERTKKALSWVNETAEIQMRLAHRERLIKNGLPSWQATARARDRLDYSQGGVISKFADVFIPYSNVAIVAWRSALKEGARDPVKAASKLTWATGTIMGLTAINMMQDIEAWMDIPAQDKITGIPILIPYLTYIDSAGNKRVGYVNIRSDNVLAPLHATVVGVLEKQMTGKVSEGLIRKTMESLPSLIQVGKWPVPIMEAFHRYASNHDTRADAPIWTGMKVPPELEFKGPASQRPTSVLFKELGELTGLSPERLDRSSRAMLPNNPYIGGAGALTHMALDIQDPSVRSKSTMEMLAQNQNLSRVVKFTHPAHREVDEIERAVEKYGAKVKPLYDAVDAYVVQFGQREVSSKDFGAWVSAQPPELQKQLSERFKNGATIDKAMREGKASEGIPSRVWWMRLAHEPAEIRAELYHERWISADGEERKRLDKMAATLTAQGIGFASEDFKRHFSRAQQRFKDDKR